MSNAKTSDDVPLPHPGVTCLLALALFLPFCVHMLVTEPYPALILPAGENRADLSQDTVTIKQIVVQAKREGSEEFEDIPPEQFLDPAPKHYLHSMARNQFGLVLNWTRRIRGRKGIFQFDHAPIGPRQEGNIEAAKAWYAQRLTELGYDDSEFYLATYERKFTDSTEISQRQLIDRQTYELH